MTQIEYFNPDTGLTRNRRTRLLVMGILLTLGGAGAFGILAIGLFMLFRYSGPPSSDALIPVAILVVISSSLLATGIGSMMRRRWSRPFILAGGRLWFLFGVNTVVISLLSAISQWASSMRAEYLIDEFLIPGAIELLICIAIPLTLILLYRGDDVQATLDFYDFKPRWTDNRPISVLGLGLLLVAAALVMLPLTPPRFVLFGMMVAGNTAQAVPMGCAALMGLAAVLVFLLRRPGWWLATLVVVIPVSITPIMISTSRIEVQRVTGASREELKFVQSVALEEYERVNWYMVGFLLVSAAIGLGYLVATWRAFHPRTAMPIVPSSAPEITESSS